VRRKKMVKKKAAPMMVVTSKMKDHAKGFDVRVSGDFAEALNDKVAGLIESAVGRCKSNNRGTLRPSDL
jgi:hypothetical protein